MGTSFSSSWLIRDTTILLLYILQKVISISNKKHLKIKNIDGPQGIRGRNSNNELIFKKLGWKPSLPLEGGLRKTYQWITEQIKESDESI